MQKTRRIPRVCLVARILAGILLIGLILIALAPVRLAYGKESKCPRRLEQLENVSFQLVYILNPFYLDQGNLGPRVLYAKGRNGKIRVETPQELVELLKTSKPRESINLLRELVEQELGVTKSGRILFAKEKERKLKRLQDLLDLHYTHDPDMAGKTRRDTVRIDLAKTLGIYAIDPISWDEGTFVFPEIFPRYLKISIETRFFPVKMPKSQLTFKFLPGSIEQKVANVEEEDAEPEDDDESDEMEEEDSTALWRVTDRVSTLLAEGGYETLLTHIDEGNGVPLTWVLKWIIPLLKEKPHGDLSPGHIIFKQNSKGKLLKLEITDYDWRRHYAEDELPPFTFFNVLGQPEERADVFAIGAILYLVATGKHVHPDPERLEATLRNIEPSERFEHLEYTPIKVNYRKGHTKELIKIVNKTLKEPSYTLDALEEDLTSFLEGKRKRRKSIKKKRGKK